MPIPVRCVCGKQYSAKDAHAGKSIKCSCGRTVPIPGNRVVARVRRWLAPLSHAWVAIALGAALFLWLLGDRWWPATLLLYSPRWPLLLPGIVLIPAALLWQRRLLQPLLLALAVILIPVMGWTVGWRGLLSGDGAPKFRVVTFNVAGARDILPAVLVQGLSTFEPDVVALQECPWELVAPGQWGPGWHTWAGNSICLASRHPIASARVEERVRTGAQGGTGTVVLFRIAPPSDSVDVAVVHLETPRKGMDLLRGGSIGAMRLSLLVRDAGSSRSSRWIRERAAEPVIAGDFNLTVESAIYRKYWSGCRNAFSSAGKGFGYTRVLKRFSIRIDHVLGCGAWRPVRARVGPDLGSDHLPLIVDLVRN